MTERSSIDWSKQSPGVHHAPFPDLCRLMPEVGQMVEDTFPDDPEAFTWDVKVHMLMPLQYPCIPHWHADNVPRENGIQRFDLIKPELPMYLWISGPPLTQFLHGFVQAGRWHRFTQRDQHRGTASGDNCWRGFIRASHKGILPPKASDFERRHSQVYVDSETFQW